MGGGWVGGDGGEWQRWLDADLDLAIEEMEVVGDVLEHKWQGCGPSDFEGRRHTPRPLVRQASEKSGRR